MRTYNNNILYHIKKLYQYCCRQTLHWFPQAPRLRLMAWPADAGDYAHDDLNIKVPWYL
jgi:hypothetical protein